MPELFDTHCHLTFKDLLPRAEQVIADAVTAGVTRMVTIACRADEVELALDLRRYHDQLWVAAGIHPHEAAHTDDAELQRLAEYWQRPELVGAGEMGLDFHYDFSPREMQETVFKKQLEIAAESHLPVIIHAREAHDRVVRILSEHGYDNKPVVFHCFSGTPAQAAEILDHGWWLSFTGIITFKNAEGPRQALTEAPIDRLMFETDAPYLSPEPVRKMRPNEPKNVGHIVRFAAELRGVSLDHMTEAGTRNANRFYEIEGV
jgi:TatD DNase family protein